MNGIVAESYRAAREVARSRARNFYYSFTVLPAERRRALCAVYAFMRHCDDISDESGETDAKRRNLKSWRSKLEAVMRGDTSGSPILPAFHDAVVRFSIPADYFHWIIDGAEMDLDVARYSTFDDLYRYCFNVASAVGLVCLQIFGFSDPQAKAHAEACGIAFQLTNILRDVGEDARMGRIYIPGEDLRRFSYREEDLIRGVVDERFREVMQLQAGRAEEYYRQARRLVPLIDEPSRPALWAMIEIYQRLLGRIRDRGFEVFRERVRLSATEKSAIALRALAMRSFPRLLPGNQQA